MTVHQSFEVTLNFMNPNKVDRLKTRALTDLPNIGPAMVRDFKLLGIKTPEDLKGRDPLALYEALCEITEMRHDPCVLDTFMSVTDFLNGGEPKPWWDFTAERKRQYGKI